MANRKKKNYKIDGNKIIAKIAELTPEELQAIKNYIALGYELTEPEKKKGITVAEMREALNKDAKALAEFERLYKTKADEKKGIKAGYFQACKYFNEWKKENK